ncbi:unnamed protein product, partial [Ectocarpus sp. 12 AP-2014]
GVRWGRYGRRRRTGEKARSSIRIFSQKSGGAAYEGAPPEGFGASHRKVRGQPGISHGCYLGDRAALHPLRQAQRGAAAHVFP